MMPLNGERKILKANSKSHQPDDKKDIGQLIFILKLIKDAGKGLTGIFYALKLE